MHIQRSCGYALRPTLSIDEIARAVKIVKSQDPNVLVLVDNCYGEFTEVRCLPRTGYTSMACSMCGCLRHALFLSGYTASLIWFVMSTCSCLRHAPLLEALQGRPFTG